MTELLTILDNPCNKLFGLSLSTIYNLLTDIHSKISDRFSILLTSSNDSLHATSMECALSSINFYCEVSPNARRAWELGRKYCTTLEELRWASFQLSELCHDWIYTLNKSDLINEYGEEFTYLLPHISIVPGELNPDNAAHFFMNNPIWSRPFVDISDSQLMLPIPNLIYSFPFRIIETLIELHPSLKQNYYKARSKYLESKIRDQIQVGLPNAKVYSNVKWYRDNSNTMYENDVVVLLGNTIFLFEAKSGSLDDASRRGAEFALRHDLKDLFIKPAEQARRLEEYLNAQGSNAQIKVTGCNQEIELNLQTPKVIHKFSICMEHFAALTSAKHNLRQLDLIKSDDNWSPVLSLGEFLTVCRHLDTEISLFHYLTRRATLEEALDFEGDEQDILSFYLGNGLYFDQELFEEKKLGFLGFDAKAREVKEPSQYRTRFETIGINLPRYWRQLAKEIYLDEDLTHRYDILQVIMNQHPYGLQGVRRQGERWMRGIGRRKGDVFVVQKQYGKRTFVLAYHVGLRLMEEEEWRIRAREVAVYTEGISSDLIDYAAILKVKRSPSKTYDAVSFFRMARDSKG